MEATKLNKVSVADLIEGNTYYIDPRTKSQGVFLGYEVDGSPVFDLSRRGMLYYGSPATTGKRCSFYVPRGGLHFYETEEIKLIENQ